MEQCRSIFAEYSACPNSVLLSSAFSVALRELNTTQNTQSKSDLYQFLLDKCTMGSDEVSKTAAIALLKQEYKKDDLLLVDLHSALPHAKSFIGSLMVLSAIPLRSEVKYNLSVNPHPLLAAVMLKSESLCNINTLMQTLTYQTSETSRERTQNRYEPVFIYVLLGSDYKLDLIAIQDLWLSLRTVSQKVLLPYFYLLPNNVKAIPRTQMILKYEHAQSDSSNCGDDDFILKLSSLLNTAGPGPQLTSVLQQLREVLVPMEGLYYAEQLLVLLATVGINAQPTDMHVMRDIAIALAMEAPVGVPIFNSCLLKWNLFPCIIESDATLELIASGVSSSTDGSFDLISDPDMMPYLLTNHGLFLANEIVQMLKLEPPELSKALTELRCKPVSFLRNIFPLFVSILLTDAYALIFKASLELMLKVYAVYPEVSGLVLSLVLSKLSSPNLDGESRLYLLHALPVLARRKENVKAVLSILTLLRRRKQDARLTCTALLLLFELWQEQASCYPMLQELLNDAYASDEDAVHLTQAHIVRRLCATTAHAMLSEELLAHLSKILNGGNRGLSALPVRFALEGLSLLAQSDVVHVETVWPSLVQRFKDESAYALQSFCKWISELHLVPSEGEKIDEVRTNAATILWQYIANGNYVTESLKSSESHLNPYDLIATCAFAALENFSIENISATMPPEYRQDLTLDNFSLLPGRCWLTVLQQQRHNVAALHAAGTFVIALLAREVDSFRPHVYMVSGAKREPPNFSALPYHSVLAAIGRCASNDGSDGENYGYPTVNPVRLQCLRILAADGAGKYLPKDSFRCKCEYSLAQNYTGYSKPLPPRDWNFLQEYLHIKEYKQLALVIACHQVGISGSARRLIENYILLVKELTDTEEILLTLLNLRYLCNSIQPLILEPFLDLALNHYNERDIAKLRELITNMIEIFNDAETSESNKYTMLKLSGKFLSTLQYNKPIFKEYVPIFAQLPPQRLDEMKSQIHSDNQEQLQSMLHKMILIKFYIIQNSTDEDSFKILDKLFNADYLLLIDESFLYEHLYQLVNSLTIENRAVVKFLMDIVGKVQVQLAHDGLVTDYIIRSVEMFIKLITSITGYVVFHRVTQDKPCIHFGFALQLLTTSDNFKEYLPQILNWISYLSDKFSAVRSTERLLLCKRTIETGLFTLRNEDFYSSSNKLWMRNLQRTFDIIREM